MVGVPKLTSRATDLTATLNAEQLVALENKLAAFETKQGSQILVLIVPTTGSKDIAQFSLEVADLLQAGRKNIDNSAILLVAKDDHNLHLEVGYDLKAVLTNALVERVILEIIKPYFDKNDYAGGIDAGLMQIMSLIEGGTLPASSESMNTHQHEQVVRFMLLGGLLLGLSGITLLLSLLLLLLLLLLSIKKWIQKNNR